MTLWGDPILGRHSLQKVIFHSWTWGNIMKNIMKYQDTLDAFQFSVLQRLQRCRWHCSSRTTRGCLGMASRRTAEIPGAAKHPTQGAGYHWAIWTVTKNTWMEAKMAKKWTILDNMILYSSIEVAPKYQSVILYRLLVVWTLFFLVLCNSFTDPIHFVWLFGKPSILSHFLFNGSSWVYSFVEDCFEKIELVDRVKEAIARGVPKTLADTASPEASNAKAWGLGNYWSSGHCGINFTLILIPFLTLKMVID